MDLFELIEQKNHVGLKRRLQIKKDDLGHLNRVGQSPLCVATDQNDLVAMGLLIEAKADVNFITLKNVTLLDLALSKSYSVAGQMLYDNGGYTKRVTT